MQGDQVKYTDLFSTDIVSGLNSLKTALEEVVKQIAALKQEATALKRSISSSSTATRQQQQDMSQDAAAVERNRAELKRLTDEEARLKAAIAEANRMTKLQAQAEQAAAGSLNEMRARYKLLVAEMGRYNLKTEEGRRKMQTTAAEARKLRDEIYKLEASYGQFGRNVGNYTGALGKFGTRLKEAALRFVSFNAAFLSFTGAWRFTKEMVSVRKELESTLVTFKALAGEVQGAKLFEEIKQFAFTTPVTLSAAAKATQTMLSFGVAQEKVVDIMKRLGDISAADSERMQRLSLAYAQATQAGRLMGQDTLQFINAGFNPLYYISLRTGKSMMELRKEMQAGRIPIEMVTQAIVDATSEGGQFNNMLEKQKETMKGAANIMQGAWQNMLNEMGEDMQSGIVGILKWLTELMKNWRQTMRVLREVAVSVGVAKAALLLYKIGVESTTTAVNVNTAAVGRNSVAVAANATNVQKATIWQRAWGKATAVTARMADGLLAILNKFKWFAILSAITMIAQKVYDVATASSRAAEEIKEFEKNASEGVTGLVNQYMQLKKEWNSLGKDQSERATWIKEHKRLFDELGVSIDSVAKADWYFSHEGTEAYVKAVRQRAIADAYQTKVADAALRVANARDELSKMGLTEKEIDNITQSYSTKRQLLDLVLMLSSGGDTDKIKNILSSRKAKKAIDEYVAAKADLAMTSNRAESAEMDAAVYADDAGVKAGTRTTSPNLTTTETDAEKRLKALQKAMREEESRTDALRKREQKTREQEVALMEEGFKKEVKMEQIRHQNAMENIEDEAEKYKDEKVKQEAIDVENRTHEKKMADLAEKEVLRLFQLEQQTNKEIFEQEMHTDREVAEFEKQQAIDLAEFKLKLAKTSPNYRPEEIERMKQELEKLRFEMSQINVKYDEQDFKARQEIEKRQFELTKHTAKEEKKFVMQQQMEFLNWRIKNAKALGISPELLELMKKEYAEMEKLFKKGIYSDGKKNTGKTHSWSNIVDLMTVSESGDDYGYMESLFGQDTENINRWKNGVTEAFNQAKNALQSWMDAKKQAADLAKEEADDAVSAAENALNREIEFRNQGYANNVALREKELAEAKRAQKEALEEQKKVARQEQMIEAASQASSLITASANLIASGSKGGIAGLIASIAAMGVMWGAFAAAQVKAYQMTNKKTQFREGGVMLLEGGSHQSGHDVNLGIGPDGSNLRAEGGEYFAVINKRNSRRYGSEIPNIVNALNSGMFEDRYIKTSDAVGMLPRIIKADDGSTVDLSAVESGVGALVKQGERTWSTEGDYRVLRYKNLTRRVKIG